MSEQTKGKLKEELIAAYKTGLEQEDGYPLSSIEYEAHILSDILDKVRTDLLDGAKIGPWVAEYGEPVIIISKDKFERWFGKGAP